MLPYQKVDAPFRPLPALLLVSLSVGMAVWVARFSIAGSGSALQNFLLLDVLYGSFSAWFVISRIRSSRVRFFDIPVFITIVAFVRFGLVPIYWFLDPFLNSSRLHEDEHSSLLALVYVLLGMFTFWLGCNWIRRPTERGMSLSATDPASLTTTSATRTVLGWAVVFYAASFAARLYLLHQHMYSYTQSLSVYYQHLASAQILMGIAQLGKCAMIFAAIERYSYPSDRRARLVFVVLLASECIWGLISGMKGALLWDFIVLALVSSHVQKRFRIGWLLAAVLGLILIYPFSNEYRVLIRNEGMEINSLSSAQTGVSQALSGSLGDRLGLIGWLASGAESAADRLDLLQSVSAVIWMGPQLADVRTRGHWWTLPFYPFVPRFLWPSKPIEEVGVQLNVALGGDPQSATAITYPGDLYLEFGLPGVLVGMFCLGLLAHWLTNKFANPSDKAGLFLYAALFPAVVSLEDDAFGFWTGMIRWLVILSAVAWLVYGSQPAAESAFSEAQQGRLTQRVS